MMRPTLLFLLLPAMGVAQSIVSIGDSIGVGVQSADVSAATQVGVYSKLVANQARTAHPLPLILSNPFATVFSETGRYRLNPLTPPLNLAISGADVSSVLTDRPTLPIDSETDRILTPFTGSQVEVAEQIGADITLCWIGSNDALSAILSFDELNASQLTSVSVFQARFREIAQRLSAASDRVVFGNIPRLANIAYVFDAHELEAYAGSSFGLPEGHLTSLVAATALRTGLVDGSILNDPDYVLDPTEIATIQQRIDDFNAIIATEAAAVGALGIDVANLFDDIEENGFPLFGLTLTNDFLGGLFSLDGVHPSNIGHALIANEIIRKSNAFYGTSIPEIGPIQLWLILFSDPHVDKDADGRVTGRPLAGLLETLSPLVGISGDLNDFNADAAFAVSPRHGRAFVQEAEAIIGRKGFQRSLSDRALDAVAATLDLLP